MDSFGKLVERSHLTLVVLGAFLLLVAALAGGSSAGTVILAIEPIWRYVLASIGIVSFVTGLYLTISRRDSDLDVGNQKTEVSPRLDSKPPSTHLSNSADLHQFINIGMDTVHDYVTDQDLQKILGNSRDIKVLKTWFPETPEIESGLELAIQKSARVRLLLCKPGAKILEQRSLGAGEHASTGSRKVYRAVERIYDLVTTTPSTDVQIACYDSWPGCPVIWYDDEILMGFYFRGKSSPKWPWISVRTRSALAKILNDQFDELWNRPDAKSPDTQTEKLDTPEKMAKWLAENKRWREE